MYIIVSGVYKGMWGYALPEPKKKKHQVIKYFFAYL